jgi:hypothetical protein
MMTLVRTDDAAYDHFVGGGETPELNADIRQADEAFRRRLLFRRALRQKRIQHGS